MSAQHTPEPWKTVEHNWECTGIYPATGSRIAVCEINGAVTEETQDHYEAIHVADAKRIVACINACAGTTTDDLNRIANFGGWEKLSITWKTDREQLEQQRDELLALLDRCQKVMTSYQMYHHPDLKKKLEAIAKVGEKRCEYCDGTGDVHGLDGEWRGECTMCDAAKVGDV